MLNLNISGIEISELAEDHGITSITSLIPWRRAILLHRLDILLYFLYQDYTFYAITFKNIGQYDETLILQQCEPPPLPSHHATLRDDEEEHSYLKFLHRVCLHQGFTPDDYTFSHLLKAKMGLQELYNPHTIYSAVPAFFEDRTDLLWVNASNLWNPYSLNYDIYFLQSYIHDSIPTRRDPFFKELMLRMEHQRKIKDNRINHPWVITVPE